MLRQWDFFQPTRIVFGRGSVRKLAEAVAPWGRAPLWIGYRDAQGLQPIYDSTLDALRKAGLNATACPGVTPEPPGEEIAEMAAVAKAAGADVIVACGGGSVVDAAKAVALLCRTEAPLDSFFLGGREARPLTDALPVVAVPTTAGTGSEVTEIAVVGHRDEQGRPFKASLFGPVLRPKVAVLDPDLTLGCPAPLTAACGADALAHAIEACLSRRATPVSTLLAGEAVRLISTWLPKAVASPDDPQAREPLLLAATLAGQALSTAGVTAAHAVAHALGAVLGMPHAVAVAEATPVMLRHNLDACREEYAALAERCGLARDDSQPLPERFVEHITGLLDQLGLLRRGPAVGPVTDELLDRLVADAFAHTRAPITLNPARMNEAALRGVFAALLSEQGEKKPG